MQAPVNYIQPMAADFIGSTAGQTAPIAPMAGADTASKCRLKSKLWLQQATPGSDY